MKLFIPILKLLVLGSYIRLSLKVQISRYVTLVLDLKHEGPGFFEGELKARVKIVPGTRHTSYFRNESGIGWVYRKWLWIPGADKYEFSELEAIYDSKKRDT